MPLLTFLFLLLQGSLQMSWAPALLCMVFASPTPSHREHGGVHVSLSHHLDEDPSPTNAPPKTLRSVTALCMPSRLPMLHIIYWGLRYHVIPLYWFVGHLPTAAPAERVIPAVLCSSEFLWWHKVPGIEYLININQLKEGADDYWWETPGCQSSSLQSLISSVRPEI